MDKLCQESCLIKTIDDIEIKDNSKKILTKLADSDIKEAVRLTIKYHQVENEFSNKTIIIL